MSNSNTVFSFIPGSTIALYINKHASNWSAIEFFESVLVECFFLGTHTNMSLIVWSKETANKIGDTGWPLYQNKKDLIDNYNILIPTHLNYLLAEGKGDWVINNVIKDARIISFPIFNDGQKCSQCQMPFPHKNELICDICKVIISL